MSGHNQLILCQAAICEVLQHWIDAKLRENNVEVVGVSADGDDHFVVGLSKPIPKAKGAAGGERAL